MNLKIQVLTIIFSILYGCFSYIIFLLNKKLLLNKNVFKKIISSLIFIFIMFTLYFICIKYINYAIITIYSYLGIIIGIFTMKRIIKK